jgi:cobalt-zinc-cadmium efflux system membrane fusion protein
VFRAKGDWCEEHGFAESFCPICNPDAHGRPPGDVSAEAPSDGAPAEGTRIRFRTKDAARHAGLQTAPVVEAAGFGGTTAVARIIWDATRVAVASAHAAGVVQEVAVDVGSPVRVGDRLASIRSATVGADRAQLVAAHARVATAEAALARTREMLATGVRSASDVQRAELALAEATADAGALSAAVGLVGGGDGSGLAITAPRPGVVTRRDAWVGTSVAAGTPLFEIVDVSSMWAEVDVPDTAVGAVHVGTLTSVTVDGVDGAFPGAVAFVAPSVDPATRTVAVRVRLDNPDGILRANMYGEARLDTGGVDAVLVVPAAAVQRAQGVDVVFVRTAEDEFILRRVRVVAREGDVARVTGALAPDDLVVTSGSFVLKTEVLKDSLGAGCCDVE